MKRLKIYLTTILLSSLCIPFSGCGDDDINLSPEEAEKVIIGKWKLIKQGPDEENIKPVAFDAWIEFLQYNRVKNQTQLVEYHMDQQYLYINKRVYEYKFTNKKNTLTLRLRDDQPRYLVYGYPIIHIYQREK